VSRNTIEKRVLEQWALPEATAGLRGRVLTAATARVAPPATAAERVWFSRRWRLAGAATLVAVLLLDRVPMVLEPHPLDTAGAAALDIGQAVAEAARQLGMTADEANAIARHAVMAATRPTRDSRLTDPMRVESEKP
jgi:hypothetical protein